MDVLAAKRTPTVWIICPLVEHLFRVQSLRALITYLSADEQCRCVIFSALEDDQIQQARTQFPSVSLVVLDADGHPGFSRMAAALLRWVPVLRSTAKRLPPDHVLLIDKWGLLLMPFVKIQKAAATYFNFELRVMSETKRISRKLVNGMEAILHRMVGATITQDEWRFHALKREHRLPDGHTVYYLPNSPIGRANIARNPELRRKLNVPPDATLLIYIGSLVEHFMIRELVDAARGSERLSLVIHSPKTGLVDSELRSFVRSSAARHGNLHLSEAMLEPLQLNELIQGSDIGVSFIKPVEGNYLNEVLMGFSSGKMCAYMQSGLPIITSRLPSVEWVEESGSGACIAALDAVSLRRAAETLMKRYYSCSQSAAAFFDKELSLDNYLPSLMAHILQGGGSR